MKFSNSMIFKFNMVVALSLATMAILTSCNSYVSKVSGSEGDIAPVEKSSFKTFSFNQVYNSVIEPKCKECHSAEKKGQPDLRTYASFMRFIQADSLSSELYIDVATGDMPKNQPALGPNSLALLKLWILSGAPEFAGQGHEPVDGPTPPPADIQITVDPTFSSLAKNVFDPYCIKCHSAHPDNPKDKDPAGGIDFTSYDKLANSESDSGIPVITPGKPELSSLFDEMNKREMPKPLTKPRLSQSVTDAIAKWITDGANNN